MSKFISQFKNGESYFTRKSKATARKSSMPDDNELNDNSMVILQPSIDANEMTIDNSDGSIIRKIKSNNNIR